MLDKSEILNESSNYERIEISSKETAIIVKRKIIKKRTAEVRTSSKAV